MEEKNPIIQERQDKNKADLIEQLKKTPIIEIAVKKTGIGRATFYRWRKNDQDFAEKVEQALDEGLASVSDLAESRLISAIQNDHFGAIQFWLRSRHPAYKTKVELSTEKPKDELTDEQREMVDKAIRLGNFSMDINNEVETTKEDEKRTTDTNI